MIVCSRSLREIFYLPSQSSINSAVNDIKIHDRAHTAFAGKRLKSNSLGGFRPDVMMYIAAALQTFKKVGVQKRQVIALEIAVLGRSGLDINDPEDKYTLKALPGKFSGLHLLAIMYTAFRQIDPTMDSGADFSAEYQAALQMQKS